jgi:hypothetical protein
MGGKINPSDLLIPKEALKGLAKAPLNFVLGVALDPNYNLSNGDMSHMESYFLTKTSLQVDRKAMGQSVVWTLPEGTKGPLWESGKAKETFHKESNASFILGGSGSFWPLPLQRQGPYSAMMWEAALPEGMTPSWLDLLGEALTKELEGCLWTISKRYD